ncbi:PilZ domain-containing protein [Altericroceibacterium spongiae]|uniref:PilZ domain-containing protein n=1 Tax=Altericroceibacterium spongiae TaxID=2320269 RepID=A0A420EME2_9SPHN|nr:PilZ domain-containing protein [Altericroceibacterium spongiae]RKF21869.1 PilZ domain-containing protein [Altericroceibacterium spongiae]
MGQDETGGKARLSPNNRLTGQPANRRPVLAGVSAPVSTAGSVVPAPPANERREQPRHVSIYRPCCVQTASGACIGIIRNISESGAQVETPCHAAVGSEITYYWDGGPVIRAEVVWMKNGRLGLRHIAEERQENGQPFPPRAIRIPTDLPAILWQGYRRCTVRVANISQKGVMVTGVPSSMDDTLLTVEVGDMSFANASIRWRDGYSAGIGFDKAIPLKDLMVLLSGDGRIACAG